MSGRLIGASARLKVSDAMPPTIAVKSDYCENFHKLVA